MMKDYGAAREAFELALQAAAAAANDGYRYACHFNVANAMLSQAQEAAPDDPGRKHLALEVMHQANLAMASCQRIRLAIERHDWAAVAQGLHVTISIGVLRHDEPGIETLVEEGDAALRTAKQSGRNRVCMV